MYGSRLRDARLSQRLSLQEVAEQAGISTATLSRIETAKQALDVDTMIQLARILRVRPADLVDDSDPRSTREELVQRLRALDPKTRSEMWQELAAVRRSEKEKRRHADLLSIEIEELLSQIDFLRAEVEAVKRRIR